MHRMTSHSGKIIADEMLLLHQTSHLRQSHTYGRDVGHQQQADEDGHIIHEHVGHDLGQGGFAYLDGHEKGVAYRRGDVADTQVVNQDQAEVDGIHAEGLHHRKKEGGEDHDGRGHVHKGSGDEQDHVHNQKDHNRAVGDA